MTKNKNLPKEIEEQIQNLASDVYIQVEEKVTKFIKTTISSEANKEAPLKKSSVHIALQDDNLRIKKELDEKNQKIKALEVALETTNVSLNNEVNKQQKLQVELTTKNINVIKEIKALNSEISTLKQQLSEDQNIIKLNKENSNAKLEKQTISYVETIDNLKKEVSINIKKNDLLQSQQLCIEKELKNAQQEINTLTDKLMSSTNQNQSVILQLNELNQSIDFKQKELDSHKEKITTLSDDFSVAIKQKDHEKDILTSQILEYQKIQNENLNKIKVLEVDNQNASTNLLTEQSDLNSAKEEIITLKSQLVTLTDEQKNTLQRFNTNRDKQEKDNDQVRETIKYLRDENSNLINQHNEIDTEYKDKINDLEHKLIEFRLKFEYAQKQLNKN